MAFFQMKMLFQTFFVREKSSLIKKITKSLKRGVYRIVQYTVILIQCLELNKYDKNNNFL